MVLHLFKGRSSASQTQHGWLNVSDSGRNAFITKLAATLLAAYGFGLIAPITWPEIALIWGYSLSSAFITDIVKVQVYRHLEHRTPRHRKFLNRAGQSLHGS